MRVHIVSAASKQCNTTSQIPAVSGQPSRAERPHTAQVGPPATAPQANISSTFLAWLPLFLFLFQAWQRESPWWLQRPPPLLCATTARAPSSLC